MYEFFVTDTLIQHEDLSLEKDLKEQKPANVDTTMLLFERIAAKQCQIFKLKEHISFFRTLVRRIGGTISLFSGMSDEKYRENQFYNALNCYICGDIIGASSYQSKAIAKPVSLWQKIRYGLRIRKARRQLRALLLFIDRSGCRQRFLDYKTNEDYCMCMKLILSVRQPDKKADEFLERRVSHEFEYLNNLKLIQQNCDGTLSDKDKQQMKKLIEWIDKEQIISESAAGLNIERFNKTDA